MAGLGEMSHPPPASRTAPFRPHSRRLARFPSARGRSIARTIVPFFGAGAGQRLDALLIGGELFGGAGIDDAAVVEPQGLVADGAPPPRVLLHHPDPDPPPPP